MQRFLYTLIFLTLSMAALAEDWIELNQPKDGSFFQLNSDSVTINNNGKYTATWRSGAALEQPHFIYKGIIDCSAESIKLISTTHIETDRILARTPSNFMVIDYEEGYRRTVDGKGQLKLSTNDLLKRNEYPSGDSGAGRMISQICKSNYVQKILREAIASKFQTSLECNSPQKTSSPVCANDPVTLEKIYSLLLRTNQAKEACHVDPKLVTLVTKATLDSIMECNKTASGCDLSILNLHIAGLGQDLSRDENAQPCEYLQISADRSIQETKQKLAITRFRECVTQKIPKLDDRISPADTIARAVAIACFDNLSTVIKSQASSIEKMTPGLSLQILENRKQVQQQLPTKKPSNDSKSKLM